jgi:hypothetical protein
MMTELRGGSANFGGLIVISLIICFAQPRGLHTTLQRLSHYKALILAFLALPVTVLLAMLWSQEILDSDIERAVRIQLTVKEYVDCRSTTPLADTSFCIRLQLWSAS